MSVSIVSLLKISLSESLQVIATRSHTSVQPSPILSQCDAKRDSCARASARSRMCRIKYRAVHMRFSFFFAKSPRQGKWLCLCVYVYLCFISKCFHKTTAIPIGDFLNNNFVFFWEIYLAFLQDSVKLIITIYICFEKVFKCYD